MTFLATTTLTLTVIDVVGGRAAGRPRNICANFPVGKGSGTRSDIDFRIGALIEELNKVGGGAGNASLKRGTNHRLTSPPVMIRTSQVVS